MKRCFAILALACAAGLSSAQAPFTIVRPAEGSKVRENVRVLIPKNSIPRGGYVGVFINGRFVEATVPPMIGAYYEYTLNTKGRSIADGPIKLELVLYIDYNDEPRVVDRSSVNLTVANKANIPIPENGFDLRYKFRPGTEYVYTLMQRVGISSITTRQAQLKGRPAELPLDFEKIRMLYQVENSYGNGDALLRMQALPLKNKDYAVLTPAGRNAPMIFRENDMHPIYMRLSSTGFEVFGSIPAFIPFEGMRPQTRTDLYAAYPLPTLPSKPVRPGDAWQTRFQMGELNMSNLHQQTSVIDTVPARGEFLGVEWEMGHPCAKLRHIIAAGNTAAERQKASKFAMEEIIWFALDKGSVIKMVRTLTEDLGVRDPDAPAGGGAARPTGRSPRRGAWTTPSPAMSGIQSAVDLMAAQQGGARGRGRGAGGGVAPPTEGGQAPTRSPGRPGAQAQAPAARPQAPASQARIIRRTVQQIFVLEN